MRWIAPTLPANLADPIVLDLGEPGLNFSSGANGVAFDINADGATDQVAWTEGEDGILALDVDRNGTIDNGSEIFTPQFAGGQYSSSMAALASLDSNGDGRIDQSDESFDRLVVWKDADHDGVSDPGELSSLRDNGITGIDLDAAATGETVDGQWISARGTFSYADGTSGELVEVNLEANLGSPTQPASDAKELSSAAMVADIDDVPSDLDGATGALREGVLSAQDVFSGVPDAIDLTEILSISKLDTVTAVDPLAKQAGSGGYTDMASLSYSGTINDIVTKYLDSHGSAQQQAQANT